MFVKTPLMLTGPPPLASISPTVLFTESGDKQDLFIYLFIYLLLLLLLFFFYFLFIYLFIF